MKKIMLSTLMILFITSCATQKYYSDNGKEISKKIYERMKKIRYNYVINYMSEEDKNILEHIEINDTVKDSLIKTYNNY